MTHTADQLIATIAKNAREEIRVSINEFKGRKLISLRTWFKADDGSMRPGTSGINCKVDLLAEIADGVNAALAEARRQGLV